MSFVTYVIELIPFILGGGENTCILDVSVETVPMTKKQNKKNGCVLAALRLKWWTDTL